MRYGEIEKFCRSLPACTCSVQWGDHRVFKVGGRMFAVLCAPDERPHTLSFKAGDDSFAILTHTSNVVPAPYLARARWVRLERLNALPAKILKAYLARAHTLVANGLSRRKRIELGLA